MSRILLIEDEVNVSAFIKRGLEEQSHQVDVAYDGATGKSLALRQEYDVIILDVILPNANVVEVYVNYLRNKIDKPFPTRLIHTVIGMGYVMKETGEA